MPENGSLPSEVDTHESPLEPQFNPEAQAAREAQAEISPEEIKQLKHALKETMVEAALMRQPDVGHQATTEDEA